MAVDDSSGPAPSGATPTISPSSSNRGTGLVRKDSISIEDALSRPGSVRINVQGAYIVDASPAVVNGSESGQADTQDIRLPNHHGPVSHLSIDVRYF